MHLQGHSNNFQQTDFIYIHIYDNLEKRSKCVSMNVYGLSMSF